MADERADSESGGAAPSGAAAFAALAYASREKADAFLEEQTRLAREQADVARLQAEDLRREDRLRHWSLIVRHVSDVVKVTFEIALALVVVGIVAGLSAIIWTAAHDDSLVIEAFSVPPDLAIRGLTGQAMAAQLQDKLASMQIATNSGRAAKSYANSWDNGIKVMIPDTGISVGDLYRTLAGWLGHQTHITGEVYRTQTGIAITSRSNGAGGATVAGSEADFDTLLQKSAEAIYQHTQPYRYAVYLASIGEMKKALPLYAALVENGDREDQMWAHMGISSAYELNRPFDAPAENRKALAIDPRFIMAYQNIGSEEAFSLSHPGAALPAFRQTLSLFNHVDGQMSAQARAILQINTSANVAYLIGDFQTAVAQYAVTASLPDYAFIVETARMQRADCLALLHDFGGAHDAWANIPVASGLSSAATSYPAIRIESDAALQDWSSVLADRASAEPALAALAAKIPPIKPGMDVELARQIRPFAALALAERGDRSGAERLIATTPGDCYICLNMRGQIAALRKNWDRSAYWFTRAIRQSPDIPFAYASWGATLLRKGDFDGAIAKFTSANQKGPHFADPLEMWGEALIAKNRSDLALAKFAKADKYAPHWGRLHLKWGEALLWSGDKAAAKKQFAIASRLDLTQSERASLGRLKSDGRR